MKLLPRLIGDEEEEDRRIDMWVDTSEPVSERQRAPVRLQWIVAVAAAAIIPRLVYLFRFTDPQNAGDPFTDAYHHWQIAYLTKEIGLAHGRLWDMRGWEYFWGPLHPVLMNVLFFLTGSIDIVLARLLSIAFGSLAVVLIFLICDRYWGIQVAIVSAAFAALSPVAIFNDAAGMGEPIAIALVLLGIWLAPGRGFLAGIAFGMAAMVRVEAWLFGAGLVFAWLIGRRRGQARWSLALGWLLTMGLYFKFLLDQTGNPIYPLYVNFQYVGLGAGGTGAILTQGQQLLWIPLGVAVLASAVGLGWSLWKQPPSYLLLTYGFGYSALSFATYLRYASEWKERRFEFPLDFVAILAAVLVINVLPQRWHVLRAPSWALAAAGLVAVQVLWLPIQTAYSATEPLFRYEVFLGHSVGVIYNQPEYRGGVLNMPGDEPTLLYALARNEGVPGDRITSQFYDPFYYLPAGYSYSDHVNVAGPLLQCWLWDTQTRLMLLSPPGPLSQSVSGYKAFIADNPQWFSQTAPDIGNGWQVVGVHVSAPAPGLCEQAARAAA
ncbi:MAG: hypothetical protein QOG08_1345 [Chloroflexota bacterium]|nr:hypothetical protein [Chloroflexota bacterium]